MDATTRWTRSRSGSGRTGCRPRVEAARPRGARGPRGEVRRARLPAPHPRRLDAVPRRRGRGPLRPRPHGAHGGAGDGLAPAAARRPRRPAGDERRLPEARHLPRDRRPRRAPGRPRRRPPVPARPIAPWPGRRPPRRPRPCRRRVRGRGPPPRRRRAPPVRDGGGHARSRRRRPAAPRPRRGPPRLPRRAAVRIAHDGGGRRPPGGQPDPARPRVLGRVRDPAPRLRRRPAPGDRARPDPRRPPAGGRRRRGRVRRPGPPHPPVQAVPGHHARAVRPRRAVALDRVPAG